MKNILCCLGFHKWSNWMYIDKIDMYTDKLQSKCIRCDKIKTYKGITETCIITGKKLPYVMKH